MIFLQDRLEREPRRRYNGAVVVIGAGDASRTRMGLKPLSHRCPAGIQSRCVYRFHHARDKKVVGWFWGYRPSKVRPQNHFLRAATPEQDDRRTKPGPKEERVKIEGDWQEAVGEALKKPLPPEGWPKPEKKKGK